ncbi:unnamed protein product [Schistosoma margrebowiei]|uniref:Uncharacterized protein n=1 Tax=Schistosoma margrebowiei TaxID=48269 RepID=A0A183LP98_9TREM|nr:unnamed protein product [Schistosoma margrebowiei]
MKISSTLLSRHDEIQSQGQSNLRSFNSDSYSCVNMKGVSTRNYKANYKGEMKFGKCLSCEKFHSRNLCAFRNAKCFRCGKIGHEDDAGNAHIQKRLYTSLGSFHDFIVDTGSIESIISFKNLKSLDPNVVRDELSTTPDGILFLNDRFVIPPSLRKYVLENHHSGHLGVEKMKSLARSHVGGQR